jgi:hypothetical protein
MNIEPTIRPALKNGSWEDWLISSLGEIEISLDEYEVLMKKMQK